MEEHYTAAHRKENPIRPLEDVIKYLASKNGWSEDDEDNFKGISEDWYYTFYKSIDDPLLKYWVHVCLKHGGDNAKSALIKIGKESPLNKHRLAKFPINLKDYE